MICTHAHIMFSQTLKLTAHVEDGIQEIVGAGDDVGVSVGLGVVGESVGLEVVGESVDHGSPSHTLDFLLYVHPAFEEQFLLSPSWILQSIRARWFLLLRTPPPLWPRSFFVLAIDADDDVEEEEPLMTMTNVPRMKRVERLIRCMIE